MTNDDFLGRARGPRYHHIRGQRYGRPAWRGRADRGAVPVFVDEGEAMRWMSFHLAKADDRTHE